MTIGYEALIKHLHVVGPEPFGLLSREALPTAGMLSNEFGPLLKCLFAPEHGWFGFAAAGEKTASEFHPFWNLPIHSLYGEVRRPTPEMLEGLGRVIIDLPDIGVRCYTYLSSIKLMLEACADAGVAVTVLDRPIPLGGLVDGPMRDMAFASFVAPLNVPFCHGMTPAECAKFIAREEQLDVDLTVIKMRDWSHADREPWNNFLPPSPALRSWDCATLYPATVFSEAFDAIDCDRNGSLAFRVVGAPWLDIARLLDDFMDPLPACGLGVRPIRYRPTGGTYAGQVLNGLLLSVENPDAFYPVTAGVIILAALLHRHHDEMMEDAHPEWLDKLVGSTALRDALASKNLSALFQAWIDAQDLYFPSKVDLYS